MSGEASLEPKISVRNLNFQYGKFHALKNINLEIASRQVTAFIGPSGCGKSTLLKSVGGFMPPVEGSIRIRGHAINEPGPDRMMVFQEFEQLMPWKTVFQNVLFPMKVTRKFPRGETVKRADAAIEKVKLSKFRNVYPHMLSGGMKMRVAIARAMALELSFVMPTVKAPAWRARSNTRLVSVDSPDWEMPATSTSRRSPTPIR